MLALNPTACEDLTVKAEPYSLATLAFLCLEILGIT